MATAGAAAAPPAPLDNDDLVLEYAEVFALVDADQDGRITGDEFAAAVRALGVAPNEAELAALRGTVKSIYGGSLSFEHFSRLMSSIVAPKMKHPKAYKDAMVDGLNLFNKLVGSANATGDGALTVMDLTRLLTRHGDAIAPASAEQLLRFVGPAALTPDGQLDIEALVGKLVAASSSR